MSVFDQVVHVASGLLIIVLLVLAIGVIPVAWSFWRRFQHAQRLLDRLYSDLTPLIRYTTSVAENVDHISASLRRDVRRVDETITEANRQLRRAVSLAEERVHDFNALLEVAQHEAEQVFVSTASTLRGVRTGASTLARDSSGTKFARLREDDLDRLSTDEVEEPETEEEAAHVDDRNSAGTADDTPRPRVRPRARRRD
jgi:uncharacterized protein YoxC